MRSQKHITEAGFYLVEAMLALALFALFSTTLLMAWQNLANQKAEQLMLSYALDIAQDELELFQQAKNQQGESIRQVSVAGYQYQVVWNVRDTEGWEEGVLQIKWQLPSEKNQQIQFILYRLPLDIP